MQGLEEANNKRCIALQLVPVIHSLLLVPRLCLLKSLQLPFLQQLFRLTTVASTTNDRPVAHVGARVGAADTMQLHGRHAQIRRSLPGTTRSIATAACGAVLAALCLLPVCQLQHHVQAALVVVLIAASAMRGPENNRRARSKKRGRRLRSKSKGGGKPLARACNALASTPGIGVEALIQRRHGQTGHAHIEEVHGRAHLHRLVEQEHLLHEAALWGRCGDISNAHWSTEVRHVVCGLPSAVRVVRLVSAQQAHERNVAHGRDVEAEEGVEEGQRGELQLVPCT